MKKQVAIFVKKNNIVLFILVISLLTNAFVISFFTIKPTNADSPSTVQACVDTNGNLRLLKKNGSSCKTSETQISLSTGTASGSATLVCVDCKPKDVTHRINQPDLTNFNFDDAILAGSDLSNTDVSGSTFVYAVIEGVQFNGSTGIKRRFYQYRGQHRYNRLC